jgi:hypothetical protein
MLSDPGWDTHIWPGTFCPLKSRMAVEYHLDHDHPTLEDRTRAAGDFPFLTDFQQQYLLGDVLWPRARCDAFRATLEPKLALPNTLPRGNGETLLDRIVVRLVDLKSVKARNFVLEDMRRPRPYLAAETLVCLSDESLPDMEEVFREDLRRAPNRDIHADLFKLAPVIARYGTRALLPDVKTLYASCEGGWACDIQSSLLHYIIKHEPKYGLAALERALSFRGGPGKNNCYGSVISDALSGLRGEAVEGFAVRELDNSTLIIAYSAARYLTRDGSAESRHRLIEFCGRLPAADEGTQTGPSMNRSGLRRLIMGHFLWLPQERNTSDEERHALLRQMTQAEKAFFTPLDAEK